MFSVILKGNIQPLATSPTLSGDCPLWFNPQLQTESFGLPSYNALAQILPDYQHVFRTGRPEKQDQGKTDGAQNKKKDPAQINHTYETHSPHKRYGFATKLCANPLSICVVQLDSK